MSATYGERMTTLAPFAEPFTRFVELLAAAEAVGVERLPEPTAFALGTVDEHGQPSVRIVLLKAVDERGCVFYTNYESRKGRELLAHPREPQRVLRPREVEL